MGLTREQKIEIILISGWTTCRTCVVAVGMKFLACSINASCLALMNSGIAMRFLFGAVNCMIDKNDEIILDPSDLQSKDCKAMLTFVFESQDKSVVASHTEGHFSQLQFQECLLRCRHASDVLFKLYREIVNKYTSMIC